MNTFRLCLAFFVLGVATAANYDCYVCNNVDEDDIAALATEGSGSSADSDCPISSGCKSCTSVYVDSTEKYSLGCDSSGAYDEAGCESAAGVTACACMSDLCNSGASSVIMGLATLIMATVFTLFAKH